MKKYIFIDMDGTLTRSRTEISKEMAEVVSQLADPFAIGNAKDRRRIIVVSGAAFEQMEKQLGDVANYVFKMPQNGNDAFGTGHELLWTNPLTWLEKHDIFYWCWEMLHRMKTPRDKWEDCIEDRGCQISYSLIGHNAPREEKEAFDPGGTNRRGLLEALPFLPISKTKIEVVIGGTTCLDFFREGCNKGANVKRMIEEMGWNKDECVYIGDALFEGGNDSSVVGVIETVKVSGPDEALKILTEYAV